MQDSYLNTRPDKVMRKHGKSFYFASQFFGKRQMDNISLLYSMCRYIDDCADELEEEESQKALSVLKSAFTGEVELETIRESLNKLESLGVKKTYLAELLDGAFFDADGGKIKNRKDLFVYCYKVAGVVGLMMNPLLGVNSQTAAPFSVDLGVGMQLTNICRDVLEDAQKGRCYLPEDEVKQAGMTAQDLAKKGPTSEEVKTLVNRYLDFAETYYDSALKGLAFIPLRPRLAILTAAYVYRAIGRKLRHNGTNVLEGRTFLGTGEKVFVTLQALGRVFLPSFWIAPSSHDQSLHVALAGLPGIRGAKK